MSDIDKNLEQLDAMLYAAQLERAIFDMMSGKRSAAKLPIEPMVRLIGYARTGSCKNAKIANVADRDA